jgi:hypothetical protein
MTQLTSSGSSACQTAIRMPVTDDPRVTGMHHGLLCLSVYDITDVNVVIRIRGCPYDSITPRRWKWVSERPRPTAQAVSSLLLRRASIHSPSRSPESSTVQNCRAKRRPRSMKLACHFDECSLTQSDQTTSKSTLLLIIA